MNDSNNTNSYNTNPHQTLNFREAEVIALRAEVARLHVELARLNAKAKAEDDVREDPNHA